MRIFATFVSMVLCFWSVAANAEQFDLICNYGEGTEVGAEGTKYAFGPPKHVQVDLAAGLWFEDRCSSHSVYEVISSNDHQVILTEPDRESGTYPRHMEYERETGLLSETTFKQRSQIDLLYSCQLAAFGQFDRSRMSPPSPPATRMMRAFGSDEGKRIGAIAPEGLFDVFVTFEIDAGGTPLSCAARAETPLAELEEATCTFLMDGDFEFYPATDRNGDAVAGEYRTKVVFAR